MRIDLIEEIKRQLDTGLNYLEYEAIFFKAVMEYFGGNRTHAAKGIKINVRTLRNKINYANAMGIRIEDGVRGTRRIDL